MCTYNYEKGMKPLLLYLSIKYVDKMSCYLNPIMPDEEQDDCLSTSANHSPLINLYPKIEGVELLSL